jgi:hypothetical protein
MLSLDERLDNQFDPKAPVTLNKVMSLQVQKMDTPDGDVMRMTNPFDNHVLFFLAGSYGFELCLNRDYCEGLEKAYQDYLQGVGCDDASNS